jgi:hypothetical protein
VFLSSLLRDAAARLRIWCSRSLTVATTATSDAAPKPTPHSPPQVRKETVTQIRVASPPRRRRPLQRHPLLWTVKSSDTGQRLFCGPVAVAALIGADVDEVIRVIQRHRNDYREVRGTHDHELKYAFQHFGYGMNLVANLYQKSPTLAAWERDRTDWDAAYLVVVTRHWVAIRGQWLVDTWTSGAPVRIKDAPHRRKRVRLVYRICKSA